MLANKIPRVLKSGFQCCRRFNLESIERAVGIKAANHFIQSMEQNTKLIVSSKRMSFHR
jgi:hypothetical protein